MSSNEKLYMGSVLPIFLSGMCLLKTVNHILGGNASLATVWCLLFIVLLYYGLVFFDATE